MTNKFKLLLNSFYGDDKIKKARIEESKIFFNEFIKTNEILSKFSDTITIVLHGSTTRNIDDSFSDLDFWLILDENEYKLFKKISPQSFIPLNINGKEGHINPLPMEKISDTFYKKIDMFLLNELKDCQIIIDKKNISDFLQISRIPMNSKVQYAFFFNNYVAMRSYHRSTDNPMERDDEFAVLINIMNTLKHALQAAIVLDEGIYPYEKWLFVFANRFSTAQNILGNVKIIFSEIKENKNALLGPEDENIISFQLRTIRKKLINKANEVGIKDLWLEKWWRFIDQSVNIIENAKWVKK